jgi:hypothetical protein
MELETGTVMINGIEYVRKGSEVPLSVSNIVLVRTYSAGVHFGELVTRNGKEVVLKNARRLWSWRGACSLSQVAIDGVALSGSNISVVVPEITLIEAIEIIPMTESAAKLLMGAPAWKS